ncbi:hypothetical protein F2Q70_00031487 [Brassica cretica]|uniref:Uncharacterized protein n=1 Tax=Brassica cretica TaxID=69181 RepID=A0A8S9FPF9_BRACR|nr:hypothetical protein F2Q70_00031487 [Brassica cretica]KAF2550255.1 hypothetical protein F2Q68_00035897 [Brassica cretica]
MMNNGDFSLSLLSSTKETAIALSRCSPRRNGDSSPSRWLSSRKEDGELSISGYLSILVAL